MQLIQQSLQWRSKNAKNCKKILAKSKIFTTKQVVMRNTHVFGVF